MKTNKPVAAESYYQELFRVFCQELEYKIITPLAMDDIKYGDLKEFFSRFGPWDSVKDGMHKCFEDEKYFERELGILRDEYDELNDKYKDLKQDIQNVVDDMECIQVIEVTETEDIRPIYIVNPEDVKYQEGEIKEFIDRLEKLADG